MRKIAIMLCLLTLSVGCWGQAKAMKKLTERVTAKSAKKAALEAAKHRTYKELVSEGVMRTGRKYTGEALGERIAKRAVRDGVMKKMEKEGMESFLEFGTKRAMKDMEQMGFSGVKKELVRREAATATRPSAYHLAMQKAGKEASEHGVKKRLSKELVAKYAGKKGYKAFMKMSIRERMLEVRNLTKYIYGLPKGEQEKALAKLTPEMRDKVVKTRKLMTSKFPSKEKGFFKGERGNSDFVLSDDYVWKDKKTGISMTVGELRKKYNIKDPIVIPYKDGEPDFSKYAFGKVKVNYANDIDYKKLKGLHDQANEKLKNEAWVKQRRHNDEVDPTRDLIENMTVDGQYKRGCRNTYHETWDGETIQIVPDFINDACTHNGGRALAQIVQ